MDSARRNALIRAVSVGVFGPLALAVAGWPGGAVAQAVIALAGAIVGLLVAFSVEHALDWRAESRSRGERIEQLENEVENLRKLNKLLEHRTAVAQTESGINAIGMEVFSGAFTEAQKTGHFLPLSALMARMEVMQKAKGLDKPIPPPGVQ